MRIIAFIHRLSEIEKIAASLGCVTWRAPPPSGKGPAQSWVDSSPEFSQVLN